MSKVISPVATNMIKLRKNRSWTQADLADKLKVDLSKVARTEVGILKPSVELVEQLMAVFDVSADILFQKPLSSQGGLQDPNDELITMIKNLELTDDAHRTLANIIQLFRDAGYERKSSLDSKVREMHRKLRAKRKEK